MVWLVPERVHSVKKERSAELVDAPADVQSGTLPVSGWKGMIRWMNLFEEFEMFESTHRIRRLI
jgi:hypothetical protein